MVNKNTTEMYSRYSKKLPFWIINPENKPTLDAWRDYITDQSIFTNIGNDDNSLFRYDERSLDNLTIISKDPDIKYLVLDITSSTPIVSKPTLYTDFYYHVERVSFYAMGVWKIEFKRDYITLWIQFLENIRYNRGIGDIRTLTTRTNLISDNYQFEDDKLKTLPLKISGWKVEELTPANDIITKETIDNSTTRITAYYTRMGKIWNDVLSTGTGGNLKLYDIYFDIKLVLNKIERTSFCEYYVFNTEEYGMVFIPKVNVINTTNPTYEPIYRMSNNRETARLYSSHYIEKYLVNNKWASQFMGIYNLPNWLTTSVPLYSWDPYEDITITNPDGVEAITFHQFLYVKFGVDSLPVKSINYQIPQILNIENNKKLGNNNTINSYSILQSLPTYLNGVNNQINLQKHPNFIDRENNVLRFEYNFIFSGFGITTYYSPYEKIENWIQNLPQQLPSSTSKFAQYIQANQNTLQTGIWVKQEEAKINQATGIANALVGAAGAGLGVYGVGKIGQLASAIGDPLTGAFANINGGLGTIHGANQAIQGITNAIRAVNEVKFEKARVKAKYADTFNSSTRQINYSQAIDALSKEFTEGRICDIIVFPIIDNLDVLNDTIVRYGNKTYEFFSLDDLITVKEGEKFNYFEVNSENFLKETNNYPIIWEHFTYEDISTILDWLEDGIRIWKTKEVEYDYQE